MKKIIYTLFIFCLMVASGCKKYVSKDDQDPNYPATATLATLLPTVELTVFSNYHGNMARIASNWVQHTSGVLQQQEQFARYILTETDVTNDWQTLNIAGIVNANGIINLGKSNGSPHYIGIGEILKAMMMGLATDYWGDIPAREIGSGLEQPQFEPQEAVLKEIQTLLSDAIIQLQTPDKANTFLPGSDDFIHGGDAEKWIITAWILKARYANRLSKRDPIGSANEALSFLQNAYTAGASSSADASGKYSNQSTERNPWYGYELERGGYLVMAAPLVDTMRALGDPRLAAYATPPADTLPLEGDTLGNINQFGRAAMVGNYFKGLTEGGDLKSSNTLPLVTYFEAKFIEAEAALRLNDLLKANSAYEIALKEHLQQFNSYFSSASYSDSAQQYIQRNTPLGSDPLRQLLLQKWIAMFGQPEAWADWRRTNLPSLTPIPKGAFNSIPQRWPTEVGERLYNKKAIVVSDLTVPVWWAQ